MNPKRILIVGTVALTISIGGGLWGKEANANVPLCSLENLDTRGGQTAVKDNFLEALGASSDEEIYDSLLDGKSMADIAADNQVDVQNLINLQVIELKEQLDRRLADGSVPAFVYEEQKAELADIIKRSVYGEKNT